MMAEALGMRPETWRKWATATVAPTQRPARRRGRKPGIPNEVLEVLRTQYLKKYKQWGPAVLAAWAYRSGLGRFSATTVARAIQDLKDPPVQRKVPKRMRLTAPGVLWSEDGAGFRQGSSKHELLAVQDDFSRYTVHTRLVSGPASEEDVVTYLEQAFANHGAPLVLKHDGGKIFYSDQVQKLLSRHQVESLTGPRHYPQYNGRRERAFRDLRSFDQALRRADPNLPLSVRLNIAIQDLNDERPRPVLLGRTAAEVFRDRQPLLDRTLFRQEVESTHKKLLETARSRDEQESARRRAIEAVLLRNGYLEIRAGMPTDFHPQNAS